MTGVTKKRLTMVGLALAVGAALVACGGGSASADPKPPAGWRTFNVPNRGVSDVATFCDHGNRVYLYDRGVGVAAGDPSCAGVTR